MLDLSGEITDGTDATDAIQEALTEAKENATASHKYIVKVPAGEYMITSALHIWSNTTLELTDVTLINKHEGILLMLGTKDYNTSVSCSGYDGFENISVEGGILKGSSLSETGLMRIAHATNVALKNVTFDGNESTGGHLVEVAAVNGLTVKECTFQNHGKMFTGQGTSDMQEALQLDIPANEETVSNTYEDGTTNKNITITGCVFQNLTRAVGTHSMLLGAYHTNIVIKDNTFTNILETAITALNYYNCNITGNVFTNCGSSIDINGFRKNGKTDNGASIYTTVFNGTKEYSGTVRSDLKTTISGNTITVKYRGSNSISSAIRVYGSKLTSAMTGKDGNKIKEGDYRVSGVTISGNMITTGLHGISLAGAKNCVITNNTITGKDFSSSDSANYMGILVDKYSTNNTVKNNTIKNMKKHGIDIRDYSSAADITGNIISGCETNGIYVTKSSEITGNISSNTITSVGRNGIYISEKSKVCGNISGNAIKSSKNHGICVYMSSVVSGKISNNTITDPGRAGIKVVSFSKIKGNISKNTIKSAKSHGICIRDDSTAIKITANTVRYCGGKGIYIASMKNDMVLKNNKISGCSSNGICINTKTKTYDIKVKKNKIIGKGKGIGIQILSGKAVTKGNKISKVSKKIRVSSSASVKKK